MKDRHHKEKEYHEQKHKEPGTTVGVEQETSEQEAVDSVKDIAAELKEAQDRYIRLYADFENYKKKTIKDKEELIKYANESLLFELLTAIDNLEMALKHAKDQADGNAVDPLVTGVDNTLRGLGKVLEKFGLTPIEVAGQPFDPTYHHAMAQIERDDIESGMVVEEFRKGYQFKDKVLRPSMVSVSKKSA
ncbi:MAG TPA: nucleotide exchange factor GrpE [Dissulfurispiraceae bacterium]|nr:nucleotide exchange factor GrpE [Dissulfurispiraceae bacterium]